MPSSIARINLADSDRRQMMEVVSLFKERDTRDDSVSPWNDERRLHSAAGSPQERRDR